MANEKLGVATELSPESPL